jgi:MFS transporter, PPP family, 3-phenylpropionic acid transporter
MPVSLPRLKSHYFYLYAIVGCLSPYLPVYLHEVKSLPPSQIGLILAAGQTGILIMPPLMTAFADRHRLIATLLICLFSITLLSLGLLVAITSFVACLVEAFLINLAMHPQVALADGLYHTCKPIPSTLVPPTRPCASGGRWALSPPIL